MIGDVKPEDVETARQLAVHQERARIRRIVLGMIDRTRTMTPHNQTQVLILSAAIEVLNAVIAKMEEP